MGFLLPCTAAHRSAQGILNVHQYTFVRGQAAEAVEAGRAALGRVEAALAAREQKLADSWRILRAHADRLHSNDVMPSNAGLQARISLNLVA